MAAELPTRQPVPSQDLKPVPPVFTAGTSTVQLSLANHTHSEEDQLDASNSMAKKLLMDVQKDVENEEKKKSKPFTLRKQTGSTSPVPEHYAKMGILLSQTPEEIRSRSNSATVQGSEKGPFDTLENSRHLTMPHTISRPRSKHTSEVPPTTQLADESSLDVGARTIGLRPRSDAIRTLDTSSNPSPPSSSPMVQPSPPVSVISECVNEELESASSPDSGYGNTPEYSGTTTGNNNHSSTESNVTSQRTRESQDPTRTKERQLQRQRSGAIVEGQMMLLQPELNIVVPASETITEDIRDRGSTQDSLCSTSDGGSSPSGTMVDSLSESALNELATSHPEVADQPLDPSLSHHPHEAHHPHHPHIVDQPLRPTLSVPDNLYTGMGSSQTLPEQLPFHMSPLPTPPSSYRNGSESRSHSSSASSGYSSRFGSDLSSHFQQLHETHHPHHPHTPHRNSLNTAQQRLLHSSRRHGSHRHGTLQTSHEDRLDTRPFLRRTNSQPLSKSNDVRSLAASLQEEKDYFQVTDDLAKENAHFALSDALLTVIEQYKANTEEQLTGVPEEFAEDGSNGGVSEWDGGRSPSVSSTSPYSWGSFSSWGSRDSLNSNFESPSPRRVSRVSFLELIQSSVWDNSAESTAQKLLQHIARNLTGSTQGEDMNVSQMVLKLPTDFLTSLKMDEDLQRSVTTSLAHMRGNREWAPPRRQIIFHVKVPSKNLQKDMALQGHRCTGCGMKVNSTHARFFRFCNYTGKYFCQNCHTNASALIPAHIIDRWSFRKMPVSNFARDLLSKIHYEPLFNVQTVNHQIYSRIPLMQQAKDLRTQLISIKQYLNTCRRGQSLHMSFEGFAPWTTDLHLYSISDFLELKTGVKMRHLKSMLSDAVAHVKTCPLCQGKGFVCEFCDKSKDIIYPFEIFRVSTCGACSCCFHKECYRNQKCPRCQRVQQRQKQRIQKTLQANQSEDGDGSHDEQPS